MKPVTNYILSIIFISSISFLVIANAAPNKPDKQTLASDTVLAEFEGVRITVKDFENRLDKLPAKQKDFYAQDENREILLKEMIRIEVFAKEADKTGLTHQADIAKQIMNIQKGLAASEYVKHNVIEKVSVSEKEIRNYYRENISDFREMEKIKAALLFVKVNPDACPAVAEQRKALAERLSKKPIRIETKKSLPESEQALVEYQASDFFPRGSLDGNIEDKIFALKKGHKSPVLKVSDGYVVFEILDKQAERPLAYDLAAKEIKTLLKKKREKEMFTQIENRLFTAYNVRFSQHGDSSPGKQPTGALP